MMANHGAPDAGGTHLRSEAGRIILGAGPAAAPFTAAAFHPVMGAAVLVTELVFVLIVFGIIVYGTREQADRVFRLLRWLRNCKEPPAPPRLPGITNDAFPATATETFTARQQSIRAKSIQDGKSLTNSTRPDLINPVLPIAQT